MLDAEVEETIQVKYERLVPYLNETSIRMWAAVEALSLGHGGCLGTSCFNSLALCRNSAPSSKLVEKVGEQYEC